jgi:hypothetical protein
MDVEADVLPVYPQFHSIEHISPYQTEDKQEEATDSKINEIRNV